MTSPDRPRKKFPQLALLLTVSYAALLVYGTLYPLTGWHSPGQNPLFMIFQQELKIRPNPDTLTNVLVYMPLGVLLMRVLGIRYSMYLAALITIAASGLLSFCLEYIQAFLPGRVSSLRDLVLNTAGAAAGAILAIAFRGQSRLGHALLKLRGEYVIPGKLANLGLLVLGLWALSQLTPLVPSIDIDNLRHGLKPLWHTLQDISTFNPAQMLVYIFSVTGLGLLCITLLKPDRQPVMLFLGFIAAVLLLKLPVVIRQISLEAISGAALGLSIFFVARKLPVKLLLSTAALAIIAAVITESLRASTGHAGGTHVFNWIPFRGHLTNNLIGIADILGGLWPFFALGYIALYTRPQHPRLVASAYALAIFACVFMLEWKQQYITGRSADITDAIIATSAWIMPWLYRPFRNGEIHETVRTAYTSRRTSGKRFSHSWLTVPAVLLIATIAAAYFFKDTPLEVPLDESTWHRLPAPDEVPAVSLPDFRYPHPRLPAPSNEDISRLRTENPYFLEKHKENARGGKGGKDDEYSIILSAYIEPGSQDLEHLYQRLMEIEFSWRGHSQGKRLALAYDWLYDQWNETQRRQLQEKLAEAAEYLIYQIRDKQRLSPYNVVLYNSPFQALVASAIALYGDHPRGDPVMNFTHDYWKNRVLPVWQQIMGKNGGWHEGGEYVGIGIGEAVYKVPAMWRKATGEDIFKEVPGICGFLDFLVYRTRPDSTYFRWGDAGFFKREASDRIPLAIECGNRPAYSLGRCPKEAAPSAWPWGPLPDPGLCDKTSIASLPLEHYFDGTGMVVARSDWNPEATYVTFKAGNDYWSHSHLDQGAFTIYKGGALAIDSGIYGSKYGADHHANYTRQTIAHNTITVTDPEDTVAAPGKKQDRYIANDGGQRRIGSGWGIEAAPLDLEEWHAKRDIYHTASMGEVYMGDDLVVAVADITPAYTNKLSGEGTFTHRTRKVERFTRTFAYDRTDDVVVIFDRVSATNPAFIKRWLLHTMETPQLTPYGFLTYLTGNPELNHLGGRLEGHVLLPKESSIQLVGGKGYEYYVDGKNYNEDGAIQKSIDRKKQAEAGSWRVEVTPSYEAFDDTFLVVLLPSLANNEPAHTVKLLEDQGRTGCEIAGPNHTTRWWFDNEHDGPQVEIQTAAGIPRILDLRIDKFKTETR